MKKIYSILFAAVAVCACNAVQPAPVDVAPSLLRLDPLITKVTDVNFEQGDKIGLTVSRAAGVHAANAPLTFDGNEFSGDLYWYLEPEDKADLVAYYPYSEGGVPGAFSVKEDQSAGISSSDLVTGIKKDVLPYSGAVTMQFKHMLTKLDITVCNASGEEIKGVSLGGCVNSAMVDIDAQTVCPADMIPGSVQACPVRRDTIWQAIVVPQTASLTFTVTLASGKELSQQLVEMEFKQGTMYSVSAVVHPDNVNIVTSAVIKPWLEGGDVPGIKQDDPVKPDDPPVVDPEPVYKDNGDSFDYYLKRYKTVVLKDGRRWMAQNLAYLPEGYTPCADKTNMTAGLYYPLKLVDSALDFNTDQAAVDSLGYMYSIEVALGQTVGTITTAEVAKTFEGAQGICPPGWHIPTLEEYQNLVGKGAQLTTNEKAPYYDPNSDCCVLTLLNADGFNMHSFGAVTIQYNSAGNLTLSLTGYLSSNPGKISSGFILGSSFKATSTSGSTPYIPQFHGLMPFESNVTCNISGIRATMCAPLRCIADKRD